MFVMFLFLFSSQLVSARVTDNPIDYGRTPESLGGNLINANTYYQTQAKPSNYLTTDVRDLQAQIIELDRKNAELELKIQKFQVPVSTQPQVSQNDVIQNQKIDTLEKKVGLLDTAINAVDKSIQKTLDLLTKLLNLLKK